MHEGHRERLKNRFLKEGLSGFEQHNMLELLLFYAIPRKDTNEIAHRLIQTFGSFSAVFNASHEALCEVDGIGENAATLIKLIPELCRSYLEDLQSPGYIIDSSETACEYAKSKFIALSNEHVLMICLDTRGKVLHCEMIFEGEITYVNINTRRIVETAVKHRATIVILAHNHPNGISSPSGDDALMTIMVRDALAVIDVGLADHIICGADGGAFSMAAHEEFENYFRS